LLSGKYRAGDTFPVNDVRARVASEQLQRDLAEIERLRREELPSGVPMTVWAIAWCLGNPLISAVIPGCKTPGQVRGNASAAALLPD
jgi:aryl-alcohol dehydrogenase-like predicted oxidoreductase